MSLAEVLLRSGIHVYTFSRNSFCTALTAGNFFMIWQLREKTLSQTSTNRNGCRQKMTLPNRNGNSALARENVIFFSFSGAKFKNWHKTLAYINDSEQNKKYDFAVFTVTVFAVEPNLFYFHATTVLLFNGSILIKKEDRNDDDEKSTENKQGERSVA